MKRQLLSSLVAFAALLLVPTSASAIGNYSTFTAKTVEGIEMTFYVDKVSDGVCRVYGKYDSNISDYIPAIDKNTTGTVTIPSEVEGLKVTEIGGEAFRNCTGITTVNIPNTVTRLGGYAFYGCTSLTTITGISSLEDIDEKYSNARVFYNTPWYDSLPDGLLYLGKVLYKYKGTMPDNTTVQVKEGTVSIAEYAFYDCAGLTAVSIPASVTSLTYKSFYRCENLASITVAAGNTIYDSRNNCNAIVKTAANTIIVGCKNTTFPSTVTGIGVRAFEYCTSLTSLVLPNNIERLGSGCFSDCYSLESVVIGNGLKDIYSGGCFARCNNLKSIEIVSSNPYYDSRNGCNAIIETASNTLVVGCPASIIPNTITAIGWGAFYDRWTITRIDIPNSVVKIGGSAFSSMYDLECVTIGSGVKEIGEAAFRYDAKLKTIWCKVDFPFDLNENVFSDETYDNATLYVPVGSKINYMTSIGWSRFKNIVETDTEPTTAIEGITADRPQADVPVYSLSGQRLSQPQKGINIIGGKKVVVK